MGSTHEPSEEPGTGIPFASGAPGEGPAAPQGPADGGGVGRGVLAGMPRWLPRAIVLALVLFGAYQLANWAFHRLVGLLTSLLISFFLAFAIEPAVDRMADRGMRRGVATWVVFLSFLIAIAAFVTALGSLLVGQIRTLVKDLPTYINSVIAWFNDTFNTDLSLGKVQENVLHSDWLQRYLQQGAGSVWGLSASVLGGVFQALTVTLFTFYFVAEGPKLRRALCSVLPPARQTEVLRAWEIAVVKTGGYLYSRALMAAVSAVAHYALFAALGVPYAPALAVWVGLVSQFIPTVGTYLAGFLPILVAFTEDPWDALWVLVFVVLYQQFENYVLHPRITAKTVEIHPAVAFGAVVSGTALLGAVGALIAIPAVATLQGFLGAYITRYEVTDERAHPRRRRRGEPLVRRLRRALRRLWRR